MSFPVMIHLKSTLAVSALMLAGLVAASPFPYRGDEAPKVRRTAASLATVIAPEAEAAPAPATMAWTDPPARAEAAAARPVQVASGEAGEPAPAPAVAATVAPVAPPAVAPPTLRHVSPQAKAEQARRRKLARAARERQMAARQPAPAADAQVVSREAASTPQRIDPIGDILRGLGIGREG